MTTIQPRDGIFDWEVDLGASLIEQRLTEAASTPSGACMTDVIVKALCDVALLWKLRFISEDSDITDYVDSLLAEGQ